MKSLYGKNELLQSGALNGYWLAAYAKNDKFPGGTPELVLDAGIIKGSKFFGTKGNKMVVGDNFQLISKLPKRSHKKLDKLLEGRI